MEIKRYDVVHPTRAWMSYEEKGIQEHPEGEFVRYEDHKAKCEELGAIAQSASDELFKLIELMKPRPIDTAPKDGEPILVEHKTCGWMQGWPQSSGCHVPGLHGVVKWKVLKRWLPLPPEVKPWSDSPDQDKFIDMESGEDDADDNAGPIPQPEEELPRSTNPISPTRKEDGPSGPRRESHDYA